MGVVSGRCVVSLVLLDRILVVIGIVVELIVGVLLIGILLIGVVDGCVIVALVHIGPRGVVLGVGHGCHFESSELHGRVAHEYDGEEEEGAGDP